MTEPNEPRQAGDPNRYVLDEQGNIEFYDSLTLLLERADAGIDLAVESSRSDSIRPDTMEVHLHSVQADLDDIRYLLQQWYKAGGLEKPQFKPSKEAG
jgi:hypothetical protein